MNCPFIEALQKVKMLISVCSHRKGEQEGLKPCQSSTLADSAAQQTSVLAQMTREYIAAQGCIYASPEEVE